jgi:enoyl-CoA hydratase/carnithine racemase
MIQYQTLDYSLQGTKAVIRLSRPDMGNRVDRPMVEDLRQLCRTISNDESVRLVVLTGSGGVFSTGREPVPAHLSSGPALALREWIDGMQVAPALAALAVPVISIIDGEAVDHGLELALALADLIIASPNSRFGFTDLAQGRLPWDGGTQRLLRLVGPAWTRDMVLTGRTIDAHEALGMGLVNLVVPVDRFSTETDRLAEAFMAAGPVAARYAKEAVHKGMDLSLDQGLALEADLNILLHSTADRAEGIKSFMERRSPNFTGT